MGGLQLQLSRHFWQRHRDESVESRLFTSSCHFLGTLLGNYGENDAGNRLIDAMSHSPHFGEERRKLKMASKMAEEQPEEGLKLVEEVVLQAKRDGDTSLIFSAQRQYTYELHRLGRYEEIVAVATEGLEYAKAYCGYSSAPQWIDRKHGCLDMLALSCGMTGRFDESKRAFDELLASATRTYGREHVQTRIFFLNRARVFLMMVNKARDLIRRDVANGARYLDAVLIESKARDFSTRRTRTFR